MRRHIGHVSSWNRIPFLTAQLHRVVRERTRPEPLGLVRIALGLAAGFATLEFAPGLLRLSDPARLRVPAVEALGGAIATQEAAWAVIGVWLLASTAFLVGWRSRLAGLSLSLLTATLIAAELQLYSNHFYLLGLLVMLVSFSDPGAAFSLDSIARRATKPVARWPIVLVKVQVSLVYAFAAISKLNEEFLSGSILAGVLGTGILDVPEAFIRFETMFPVALLVVGSETLLSVGLWIPRTRLAAAIYGMGFHLGISLLLAPPLDFVVFGLTLVPTYLVFWEGSAVWERLAESGHR